MAKQQKTYAPASSVSERQNIAVGAAHIKSTFNNTIVSITGSQGNVISWQSAGTVGFKELASPRHSPRRWPPKPPRRPAMEQG